MRLVAAPANIPNANLRVVSWNDGATGPAHEFHRAVMAELTGGAHERLGDAILAAQKRYAETGLMPELLTIYQLLGDPAMRVR